MHALTLWILLLTLAGVRASAAKPRQQRPPPCNERPPSRTTRPTTTKTPTTKENTSIPTQTTAEPTPRSKAVTDSPVATSQRHWAYAQSLLLLPNEVNQNNMASLVPIIKIETLFPDREIDKSNGIKYSVLMEPNNANNTDVIALYVPFIRSTRNLEEFCIFLKLFGEIREARQWQQTPAPLFHNISILLKDEARSMWDAILRRMDDEAQGQRADRDIQNFDIALQRLRIRSMRPQTASLQIRYLQSAKKPLSWSVEDFYERLCEINQLVQFMTDGEGQAEVPALTDQQLALSLQNAVPNKWLERFMETHHADRVYSPLEVVNYFATIERVEQASRRRNTPSGPSNDRRNRRQSDRGSRNSHGNQATRPRRDDEEDEDGRRRPISRYRGNDTGRRNGPRDGQGRFQGQRYGDRRRPEQGGPTTPDRTPTSDRNRDGGPYQLRRQQRVDYRSTRPRGGGGREERPREQEYNRHEQDEEQDSWQDDRPRQSRSVRWDDDDFVDDFEDLQVNEEDEEDEYHRMEAFEDDEFFEAHEREYEEYYGCEEVFMTDGLSEYYREQEEESRENRQRRATTPARFSCVILIQLTSDHIHERYRGKSVRCLLDSGASGSLIDRQLIADSYRFGAGEWVETEWATGNGTFRTTNQTRVTFKLPEFTPHRTAEVMFKVNTRGNGYPVILGREEMRTLGIDLLFSTSTVRWEDLEIQMRDRSFWNNERIGRFEMMQHSSRRVTETEQRVMKILDVRPDHVFNRAGFEDQVPKHITKEQGRRLFDLLWEFRSIFEGKLGKVNGVPPIHIELKPNTQPIHLRPYSLPRALLPQAKEEVRRFVEMGVLREINDSPWAFPSFFIPKKHGKVRFVTDFRKLNHCAIRKPYPIPKMVDLMQQLDGFHFVSTLDLSMGYYALPLDKYSQRICTVTFPWGKYQYLRLPMGYSGSADEFQEMMNRLFGHLDFVFVYLDDLLILTRRLQADGVQQSFERHLRHLRETLDILLRRGFQVNVNKCHFCEKETEYLGFMITREGIRPMPSKVDAIINIKPPTTRTQLRSFIGMLQLYREMYPRRSELLAPLTALTSNKVPFQWTSACQQAFEEVKKLVAKRTLLVYPDFTIPFEVYTDASDFQLGGVITQNSRPLAYFSRKLTSAQRNYTVGEKELLSIVEVCREYRNILWGQRVIVYTDHKNLTFEGFSSERVKRWRLYVEEYGLDLRYLPGKKNKMADYLSRADTTNDSEVPHVQTETEEVFAITEADDDAFPLTFEFVKKAQDNDTVFMEALRREETLTQRDFRGTQLWTHKDKIVVPPSVQHRIIDFYHEHLRHPGATRTEETIRQHFWWKSLSRMTRRHVEECPVCIYAKKRPTKYGQLPPKEVTERDVTPWETVCVDVIGPYSIPIKRRTTTESIVQQTAKLTALTMIDPATAWFEVEPINKVDPITTALALDRVWFCRYPRPMRCVFDNGREFTGEEFQEMLRSYGVKPVPTTVRNPQANATLERMHGVIHNTARTIVNDDILLDIDEPVPFRQILATCAYAIRSTFHSVLRMTPGQAVFGRDMILPTKMTIDWTEVQRIRQEAVTRDNTRENRNRTHHQFAPGDRILIRNDSQRAAKYTRQHKGPYRVQTVRNNGTLVIEKGNFLETVNIRRVVPAPATLP